MKRPRACPAKIRCVSLNTASIDLFLDIADPTTASGSRGGRITLTAGAAIALAESLQRYVAKLETGVVFTEGMNS